MPKSSREEEKKSCPYAVPISDKWLCPVINQSATAKARLHCVPAMRNACAREFTKNLGRIPIDPANHPEEYVGGHSSEGFDNGRDLNTILEDARNIDEIIDQASD